MRRVAPFLAAFVFIALATPLRAGSTMAKLSSVIDGGTVVVTIRGAETKLRLHGVAVPPADEKRPIFKRLNTEAVAFLKEYLKDGWLYLEYPGGKPQPDAEGYIPAFVYRGADATFLNEKLVAEGLAIANRKQKHEFTDKLVSVEKLAKASQRGIWGSFANGNGEKIASGTAQGTYIGVPGATHARAPEYVEYWIILFY
jgi:endonuclease YncB( thermonuclease family)